MNTEQTSKNIFTYTLWINQNYYPLLSLQLLSLQLDGEETLK